VTGPLPLTPLERLLIELEAGELEFRAHLRLAGHFERDAFEDAVGTLLVRHPLCSSTVGQESGELAWRPGTAVPSVRWLAASDPEPAFAPWVPEREAGLAAVVREDAVGTCLFVRIHHAVCDGRGALQLLRDFFVAYARAAGCSSAALPPVDLSRLAVRGSATVRPALAPLQVLGLIGARRALGRRPLHLRAAGDGPAAPAMPIAGELDAAASEAFRRVARSCGVSENDLLLRDLFQVLAEWLPGRVDRAGKRSWLRLAVPFDLRTLDDRHAPASNAVSQVYVDRRLADTARGGLLLRSLHGELAFVRAARLALAFPLALALASRVPPLWRRLRKPPASIAPTALVSSLGSLRGPAALRDAAGRVAAGPLVLQGISIAGPLLPHVPLSFTSHRYAGRLVLDLHHDPVHVSAADAAELHARCLARLRATAGGSAGR
jgi:hypothetical protein